jgi:hypothetical protein
MKNVMGHKISSFLYQAATEDSRPPIPHQSTWRAVVLNRRERRAGFSLLELLSAMAILMIIVMLMGIIFAEGDRIWTIGTNRVDNNSNGRAALNMIAHDLQYAVADNVLTFAMDTDTNTSYDFQNSQICAVSLQHDSSDTNRAAREVQYYVQAMTNSLGWAGRYYLRRAFWSDDITNTPASHCYGNRTWYSTRCTTNAGSIAENVSAFSVYSPAVVTPQTYYSSANGDRLPEYVDICLEVLNERPARQAAELWNRGDLTGAKGIVERNQRRYTERVYFHNRYGYKAR